MMATVESISVDRAVQILREEFVAHVGVVTGDGPYVTPISYVYSGNDIAFRTRAGSRLDAMRADPRVCLEVSRYEPSSGAWESVIVRGLAREVDDPQRVQDIVSAILRKYREAFAELLGRGGAVPMGDEVVVSVAVDEITGRSSGRAFGIRTRPGRM